MFKKILAINFFGFVLYIIFVQTIYSMQTTQPIEGFQPTTIEQLNLSKISALRAYYIGNPWDFVEKKFVINNGCENVTVLFVSILIFLSSAIVTGGVAGVSIVEIAESNLNRRLNNQEIGSIGVISAFSGFMIGFIFAFALYKYLISMRYKKLISILKSYNPDLNKKDPNNTKLCIPKEFHFVFDVLWNVYKKRGEDALKKEWDKVAKLITKQILLKIAHPDFNVKLVNDVNLKVLNRIKAEEVFSGDRKMGDPQ